RLKEVRVRALIVGGAALYEEEVREWRAGGRRIINEYGPTETVVGCCVYEDEEEGSGGVAVPIGRAIGNMQMYVMDEELEPVGVGVTGEIYIGGVGVARGYQGRAELTAEKCVPHPYRERGGERLYRSGDVGRYLGDGRIEYVGR